MATSRPLIVGIGGTLRENSSSERALKLALRFAEEAGAATRLFSGPALRLPLYGEPGERSDVAAALVEAFRDADGIIVSSPCYHGGVSGMLKNAIDYTEDMRGDARVYLDGIPMGCIGCGAGWQGPNQVLFGLRSIAHALRAWPTPLGVGINTAVVHFEADDCSDPTVAMQLQIMARQVVEQAIVNVARVQAIAI